MRKGYARLFANAHSETPENLRLLRKLAVAAGFVCAFLFVAVGLAYRFQLFGDASIFSYAVAVQDSWAFHWHNISNRSTVYLYAHVPAEAYAHVTGDAWGAIRIYALLFYGAQLLGLALTYALDRTEERIVLAFASVSTAIVCPLIFGSPTEMWIAHACFWPALAAAHCTSQRWNWLAAFATFLPLAFTHEGALIFIGVILATILLRKGEWPRFWSCVAAAGAVVCVWILVRISLPPDIYTGKVLSAAASNVFNPEILLDRLLILLAATIAGFLLLLLILRRLKFPHSLQLSYAFTLAALVAYWVLGSHELHADDRYYLRTIVIVATPALAVLAIGSAFAGRLVPVFERVYRLPRAIFLACGANALAASLLLMLVVHGAETARFAAAWRDHLALFTKLVTESSRAKFVEVDPERPEYDELPWFSTLPYLSVLVAPDFKPARLAIDPRSDYFWISCATATASVRKAKGRGIPVQSREMIRDYTCRNRR